jgi:hypothetical protein
MTNQVIIVLDADTVTLTNAGIKLEHRFSNPIIVIDVPREDLNVSNSIGINIGFISETFTMSFTLEDGIGTLDWENGTTNYEKLFRMAYKKNPKTLTINDKAIYGQIEELSIPFAGGKKDLSMDCSLSFRVCMDIEMEPPPVA